MGSSMSYYTTTLADSLCGGSSRKLIAGWWYSILAITGILCIMAIPIMSSRSISEGFASLWSALMLFLLCIGGTMIMRKFHNSMAVGFFMGGVLAMSQLFFLLFLLFIGYAKDQRILGDNTSIKEERLMSFLCLIQSLLLGSFAAILGAHRSEILDKPITSSSATNANTTTNLNDVTNTTNTNSSNSKNSSKNNNKSNRNISSTSGDYSEDAGSLGTYEAPGN